MDFINFIIAWLSEFWVNSVIAIISGVITLVGIVVGIPSIISYFRKPTSDNASLLKADNFKSQLGQANTRLEKSIFIPGENPLIADGSPLIASSPLFYRRENMLRQIKSVLLHSENVGSPPG